MQSDVTATDTPRGTSVEAAEFSPALPEPTTENEVRRHTALARLGKPVADMTGAITVSGHTDNVPIRSPARTAPTGVDITFASGRDRPGAWTGPDP